MKAIPTIYRGIQFRSRLEATWAAYFDQLLFDWEYEPNVFDGPGWLPDFLLKTSPSGPFLCECKPVIVKAGWKDHECLEKISRRTNNPVLLLGVDPSAVTCNRPAELVRMGKSIPFPLDYQREWAAAKNLVQWKPPTEDRPVRVYLAGKVEKNGWRQQLGDFRAWSEGCSEECPDYLEPIKLFNGWECIGPYLLACDHGCFHTDGTHGQISPYNRPHVSFGQREAVFERSMRQISEADLVFAYIDSRECFGTLFELGAAHQFGKPYAIAFAPGIGRDDFWFCEQEACFAIDNVDPRTALQELQRKWAGKELALR